jgi:hypothetical protein
VPDLPDMRFQTKGKRWIASATTGASLARGTRGGASHGAKEGQTVFGITEPHRGSGA